MSGNIGEVIGDVDLSGIEPTSSFDALPAGWYPVQIDGADVKTTKAGNGKYLNLVLLVIGESFAGRKVFARINLVNPNPKAVEIGMRDLAAIGSALGLIKISDTEELLGKQLQAKLSVRQEEGRDPENEVKGWKALGEAETPAPAPRVQVSKPATTAPAQAKPAGKRPWEK